jgi:hypothetical protein
LEHIKKSKGKEKLEDNKSYKYFNNSEDNKNFDTTIAYHGLSVYKYKNEDSEYNIPLHSFEKLIKILGNYIKLKNKKYVENIEEILSYPFDKDTANKFYFIPRYVYAEKPSKTNDIFDNDRNEISPITHLTQVQRIVYSAVCKFFYSWNEEIINKEQCETALKQWMRVVWNLVSGLDEKGRPQIRTIDAMLKAIEFIDSIELKCIEVYSLLSEIGNTKFKNCEGWNFNLLENNFEARCLEECIKAEQILRNRNKELDFVKFEKQYRGSIRFLLLKKEADTIEIDTGDFDTKIEYAIKENKEFYQQFINYCTLPEQLTEIVYALNKNALITNLLNPKLLEPIHNMLMNKEPNGNDSGTKGLRDALKNSIENLDKDKIYRLKLRGNSYYFEVPYNRNQTAPIFPNPDAQSSSNP